MFITLVAMCLKMRLITGSTQWTDDTSYIVLRWFTTLIKQIYMIFLCGRP